MAEYVYCIMAKDDAPKKLDMKGIENSEITVFRYQDLVAVMSKTPLKEYEPIEKNVEKHKAVELHLLKDHTILPVAFGMVFKSSGVLVNTMRKVYPVLKKSLRLVDNKIELGVKAIFPKEMENFNLNGMSREEFQEECENDFVDTLSKIAVESKKGKLFSERLVFNRSFLVDRDKVDEFSEVLGKLDDKYAALQTKYTGPWPPYNFIDIRVMGRGRG